MVCHPLTVWRSGSTFAVPHGPVQGRDSRWHRADSGPGAADGILLLAPPRRSFSARRHPRLFLQLLVRQVLHFCRDVSVHGSSVKADHGASMRNSCEEIGRNFVASVLACQHVTSQPVTRLIQGSNCAPVCDRGWNAALLPVQPPCWIRGLPPRAAPRRWRRVLLTPPHSAQQHVHGCQPPLLLLLLVLLLSLLLPSLLPARHAPRWHVAERGPEQHCIAELGALRDSYVCR